MGLHLVTGKANAGKTGVLNTRLFQSLANGEAPTLVLPTVAIARRAAIEMATKAPVGIEVTSWNQWIRSLWAIHGDGRRIIGDPARAAFTSTAFEKLGEGPIPVTAGLRRVLGDAVAVMTRDPRGISAHTPALRYLLEVAACYEELIREAGLVELAEATGILCELPPTLGGVLALNRFATLSPLQLRAIEAFSREGEVAIALTWEAEFAATQALDDIVERLLSRATRVDHERESPGSNEIALLADALYSGTHLTSTGLVRLATAAGEEAEAALIARFVSEVVADGLDPDRVAVALPRLGGQTHTIQAALQAEGIDAEVDVVRPLMLLPLGRALGQIIDLARGCGDRTTANALLSGPYSDVNQGTASRLDREWRRHRVIDGRSLLAAISKAGGSHLASAAAIGARLEREGTGRNWQLLLDRLVSAAAKRAADSGALLDATVASRLTDDARAARAVSDMLGEMLSAEGQAPGLSDVHLALREVSVGGTSAERAGAVQVTDISRIGSRRFDALIIAGLTAAEAPVARAAGVGDELRELVTGEPTTPSEDLTRLAFYQAISRARRHLVLIRRSEDSQGRELRPSVLWDEVVDVYRGAAEETDAWPAGAPTLETLDATRISEAAPVFTVGRRAERVAISAVGLAARPRGGTLQADSALRAVESLEVFSATEVEAYLACPYRWFYERVVRPEEIDTELDAREIGTFAHSLLSAFYDALPERLDQPRVTPGNIDRCRALLAELGDSAAAATRTVGLVEELAIAQARRWVDTAVRQDAAFLPEYLPTGHEVSFPAADAPPVELGGASFRGRIDRIDTSTDAVFVTDYKTARRVVGQAKFAEEGKVQAVVYARAAENLTGLPCSGSAYRSLRSGDIRGFWRADLIQGFLADGDEDDVLGVEQMTELFEHTEERIAEAVAGMRAGRIPRKPALKGGCAFCPLERVCEGSV